MYLAYAYRNKVIYEKEFALLYDAHKSTNPEFPYWRYERLDLDGKTNDESTAELSFYREDTYELADQMKLPDEITTNDSLVVASVPALCLYLKWYSHPCRYRDLVFHFASPIPELSIITKHMIYGRYHNLLSRYNHILPSPQKLLHKDPKYRKKPALFLLF